MVNWQQVINVVDRDIDRKEEAKKWTSALKSSSGPSVLHTAANVDFGSSLLSFPLLFFSPWPSFEGGFVLAADPGTPSAPGFCVGFTTAALDAGFGRGDVWAFGLSSDCDFAGSAEDGAFGSGFGLLGEGGPNASSADSLLNM